MEFIITEHAQIDIIKIKGRIDSYSAPQLEKAITALIERGRSQFIIDMEEVTFISSSGILLFVNLFKQFLRENEGNIAFSGVSDLVVSGFKLAGFDRLFEFFPNQTSALDHF